MTRSLACLGLCGGLLVAVTATLALAQLPPRSGTLKVSASQERTRGSNPRDAHEASEREPNACQEDDRPKTDRPKDGDKDGRGGPRHPRSGPHAAHLERLFVFDAVRRAGGPLELMPLLHVPEVRRELQLDDSVFKPKLEAYMAEMQQRIDENRKQAADEPKSSLGVLFSAQLRREDAHFEKFLGELSESQKAKLVLLFIQARNYRSLSNQLVVAEMGMSQEEGVELRHEIEEIREQTMDETRDRFRRIFDQGGGREQFEKMVRENQRKMDVRIEKKLNDAQREKFAELRRQRPGEPPEWLVRAVDFPFRPGPPPPRPSSKDLPPPK